MTARVGIRLPFTLPFPILLLLIIQLNNTVLCASFIFLFLQSLQLFALREKIADRAFAAEEVAVAGTRDGIAGGQEAELARAEG